MANIQVNVLDTNLLQTPKEIKEQIGERREEMKHIHKTFNGSENDSAVQGQSEFIFHLECCKLSRQFASHLPSLFATPQTFVQLMLTNTEAHSHEKDRDMYQQRGAASLPLIVLWSVHKYTNLPVQASLVQPSDVLVVSKLRTYLLRKTTWELRVHETAFR